MTKTTALVLLRTEKGLKLCVTEWQLLIVVKMQKITIFLTLFAFILDPKPANYCLSFLFNSTVCKTFCYGLHLVNAGEGRHLCLVTAAQ